jgi:hypothetical protein
MCKIQAMKWGVGDIENCEIMVPFARCDKISFNNLQL